MAEEVQLRMTVDASRAKRDIDQVNKRLEKTDKTSQKFSQRARTVLTGAAAVAAVGAAALDAAAGGGLTQAATSSLSALAGSAARGIGIPDFGGGIATNQALDFGIEQTKRLVSAGGSITDQEIQGLITGFAGLREPGAVNEQRVVKAGQDIRTDKILEGAANTFAAAAEAFKNAVRGGSGGR